MNHQQTLSGKVATDLLYSIEGILRNMDITQEIRFQIPLPGGDRCWVWRCEDDGSGNTICHMVEVPC